MFSAASAEILLGLCCFYLASLTLDLDLNLLSHAGPHTVRIPMVNPSTHEIFLLVLINYTLLKLLYRAECPQKVPRDLRLRHGNRLPSDPARLPCGLPTAASIYISRSLAHTPGTLHPQSRTLALYWIGTEHKKWKNSWVGSGPHKLFSLDFLFVIKYLTLNIDGYTRSPLWKPSFWAFSRPPSLR